MKKIVVAAFIGCTAGVTSAQSMPVVRLDPAMTTAIEQVAGGCGRGWYRARDGRCRRAQARPVCGRGYRPPAYGCRPMSF